MSTMQTVHFKQWDGFDIELIFDHTPRSTPIQRSLAICHSGDIGIQYWWEHYEEKQQSVGRDTYYLMFTGGERSAYKDLAEQFEEHLISHYIDISIKPKHIARRNLYVWNVILEECQ